MRRSVACVLPAVLLGCARAPAPEALTPAPIFRYVQLNRDTIRLGEPLARLERYARSPRDTALTIPAREFAGAEEIEVYRAPNGPVHGVVFLYGEHRDTDALLAEYRQSLGAPSDSSVRDTSRGRWHQWAWRDDSTEFLFILVRPAFEAVAALSILQERGRAWALP